MADLLAVIENMELERRAGALIALDAMTRPLTAKEIAAHLRNGGMPWARARTIAANLHRWHIVALLGPGTVDG